MIEFHDYKREGTNQKIITAVINEVALMDKGKQYLVHVLQELVKQSVLVHRIEIESMVTTIIASPETKKYIEDKIRETIDNTIAEEVREIFMRGDKT